MLNNFKNAKVGDKVYCLLNGTGRITEIDRGVSVYCIRVTFNRKGHLLFHSYTDMGYLYYHDRTPMLYRKRPVITSKQRLTSIVSRVKERYEYRMELERRGVELYKMSYGDGGLVFESIPNYNAASVDEGGVTEKGIDKKYLVGSKWNVEANIPENKTNNEGVNEPATYLREASKEDFSAAMKIYADWLHNTFSPEALKRMNTMNEAINNFKEAGNNDTPIEPGVL